MDKNFKFLCVNLKQTKALYVKIRYKKWTFYEENNLCNDKVGLCYLISPEKALEFMNNGHFKIFECYIYSNELKKLLNK